MEDIFFILVFVAIAVIQGIGQKRRQEAKKRQQGQTGAPPRPPPRPGAEAGAGPGSEPIRAERSGSARKPESSEGLIPSEVWEEILGLARGGPLPPKRPPASPKSEAPPEEVTGRGLAEVPQPRAGRPDATRTAPTPRPREISDRDRSERPRGIPERDRTPRPRSPEMIRSPAEIRPVRAQESRPSRAPVPAAIASGEVGTAGEVGESAAPQGEGRSPLFGDGSVEELRKAIILKEVLGPPLSLRDERA
jgi:hypothetical protein